MNDIKTVDGLLGEEFVDRKSLEKLLKIAKVQSLKEDTTLDSDYME